jgi:hypothetical protein
LTAINLLLIPSLCLIDQDIEGVLRREETEEVAAVTPAYCMWPDVFDTVEQVTVH